jgi:hypothetical protein
MGKETEDAQPVVDGDQQHAVPDQGSVLVERARGRAALIAAAVKPEHDRKELFCRPDRSHYIEKEAIFLACLGVVPVPVSHHRLCAGSAEAAGRTNSSPQLDRQWLTPAQIAHRWLSVGNPEKLSATIRPRDAPQWAAGCPNEEFLGLFLGLGRTR